MALVEFSPSLSCTFRLNMRCVTAAQPLSKMWVPMYRIIERLFSGRREAIKEGMASLSWPASHDQPLVASLAAPAYSADPTVVDKRFAGGRWGTRGYLQSLGWSHWRPIDIDG